ncbi:MAG TPA: hypothetical protein VLG76_01360 [Rhabdochlamydiaceae bacterium]|nr:hypothetical protein [Rhabdochlamydiaceae bacterium]
MKNLYLEDPLMLDQEEAQKNDALFDAFWTGCKKQIPKESLRSLEPLLHKYTDETWKIRRSFNEFHSSFLTTIPLVVVLAHWIQGIVSDPMWRDKYVKGMEALIAKKLIPLMDSDGKNATLEKLRQEGHQQIIENIRCVQDWTPFEKEELVQCYVQFSHHLARYTFEYVPAGFDPDRRRAQQRIVKYEYFFDFVQQLSERDALIAKVLYFGATSIDETIALKKEAIDEKNFAIQFDEKKVVFPKHLIQDLSVHVKDKSSSQLVFTNVRGAEVERAHLNQSFARACERIPRGIKITPGSLLRLKGGNHEELTPKKVTY